MKFLAFILLTVIAIDIVTAIQSAPTAEEDSENDVEPSPVISNDNASDIPTTPVSSTKSGSDDDSNSSEEIDHVIDNIVSKLDVLSVDVNDDALQKCISNNNTVALTKARRADEEMEKCLEPAFDTLEIEIDDFESFDVEIVKNISQHFCKVYPPLEENCTAAYYNNIEPCLSDGDMKGMKIFDKMVTAGLEYMCQIEPDFLIEAARNEFGCNLIEHIASFVFCVVPPFQEIVRNNHTAMAIPRLLTGKGCRLYKEMSHCIHEELKTCKNTTYSAIIVGFFNVTANALPECPSERTEWEQYMGQVVGQLYNEEHAQTELLKSMKTQIDQLIVANALQSKFLQEDKENNQNVDKALHSILGLLNAIKKER
ncbi:hypothetical protein R5R35_008285 [Gryllus longicercus]|uniref:Uncharacterized protein n=1 Tax=Gryllus longicercus TaxID=2509291 RepID=A0AAN9VX13_9ORTH